MGHTVVDRYFAVLAGLHTYTFDALISYNTRSNGLQMLCLVFKIGIGMNINKVIGEQFFQKHRILVDHSIEPLQLSVCNRILCKKTNWKQCK